MPSRPIQLSGSPDALSKPERRLAATQEDQMTGPVEEVGKAASAAVDALKSQPMVLALVIFNCLFMAFSGYVSLKISERWSTEIERWERLVHACQNIPPRP